MKRLTLFLIVLGVLACQSCAYALDERFYGEWRFYYSGTMYPDPELSDPGRTVADAYEASGEGDVLILNDDGTAELRTVGRNPTMATWVETDEDMGPEFGDAPTILLTDSTGTEALFFFVDGMMYLPSTRESGSVSVRVYYKPDLYQLNSEPWYGTAWKMSAVFSDTPEEVFSRTIEHPAKWPDDEKLNCYFTLHEDMSADVLLNFAPYKATWFIDGFNVCLALDNGDFLKLENQYNSTLFGTLMSVSNDKVFHVEFEPDDVIPFPEPLALADFEGTWTLFSKQEDFSFYSPEDLGYTETLVISGDKATLDRVSDTTQERFEYAVRTVGVPVQKDYYTGTAILLEDANGNVLPLWLMTDGRLYLRMPGDVCSYFVQ